MIRHNLIVLLTFLSASAFPVFGLGTDLLRFERLSMVDGLPHNNVQAIFQDSRGFLWVGTGNGLGRFDGYEFKIYRHDPEQPHSLPHNSVTQIVEDSEGHLWIGTWGGWVARFDTARDTFERFDSEPFSGARVQSMAVDSQGNVWVGSSGHGLVKLNVTTGVINHFEAGDQSENNLISSRVWSLALQGERRLWIGTEAGLSMLDLETEKFKHWEAGNEQVPLSQVQTLAWIGDHQLWVGSRQGLTLLKMLNDGSIQFDRYFADGGMTGPANDNIRAIKKDHLGRLWIVTASEHITLLDPETKDFSLLKVHPSERDVPLGSSVLSMTEDASHIMWIGTTSGIYKSNLKKEKFEQFFHIPNGESLTSNRIGSIASQGDRLFVGLFTGEVNVLDERGRLEKNYAIADKGIRAILPDGPDKLWLGAEYLGLVSLDLKSGEPEVWGSQPDNPDSLSSNRVFTLAKGGGPYIWVGSAKGLNRFNTSNQRFDHAGNHPFLKQHTSTWRIDALLYEQTGFLWVGSSHGLVRLNLQSEEGQHFQFETGPASQSANKVRALYRDSRQNLWVGAEAGLVRLDDEGGFTRFQKQDGLPDDAICGILEDEEGLIWVSTKNGLSRFDTTINQFSNFDVQDGMLDSGFNFNVAHQNQFGKMFFGSNSGFIGFLSENVVNSDFAPPVRITGISIIGTGDRPAGSIEIPSNGPLLLKPGDKKLTMKFAALDLTFPEKNDYQVMMERYDDEWIDLEGLPTVTYTNLDAGSYVFRVRGSNSDGVWNDQELQLPIKVIPPFYKTTMAYVTYAVLLIVLGFGLPMLRITRLKIREEELADQVARRTRELSAKNNELADKNLELLAFDEIVQSLNREVKLEKLLDQLLSKGIELFDHADAGWVLVYEAAESQFRFASAVGVDLMGVGRVRLSRDEAMERYILNHEKLDHGIYLIDDPASMPQLDELVAISSPKSMVLMTVEVKGEVDLILIFENHRRVGFLSNVDIEKMHRFRQHAVSALFKARTMETLTETANDLRDAQAQLVKSAHSAGMAEVAQNVLHNVGNRLTSITTTTNELNELTRSPSLELLQKISTMMEENKDNLLSYLSEDRRGRQLPAALIQVINSVSENYRDLKDESRELIDHVRALHEDLSEQRDAIGSREEVLHFELSTCLDEVLYAEQARLEKLEILVLKEYESLPLVNLPRTRFLSVINALVVNGAEAMAGNESERRLTLRCISGDEDQIRIEIKDNGSGISAEAEKQIFNQGFTTKKKSSSFGLHYCANVIKEMGGELGFQNYGLGLGAMFYIDLPWPQAIKKAGNQVPAKEIA